MRKANDSKFVFDGDVLVGINLGADFTSEHEWGIDGIKRLFGIASGPKDWGVDRRKITKVPDTITFGWTAGYDGKGEGFYLLDMWHENTPNFAKYSELRPNTYLKNTLACAWDNESFGVFSTSTSEIGYLHEIYDAFLNSNGAILLGGHEFIENAGLCLFIASRVSHEITNKWYTADKDRYDLNQEAEATGIHQLLKEKGKGYYALSPRRQSDGSILFWLNPMEQQANNYGFFSLKDLKEWAEGKGKIPKTELEKRQR